MGKAQDVRHWRTSARPSTERPRGNGSRRRNHSVSTRAGTSADGFADGACLISCNQFRDPSVDRAPVGRVQIDASRPMLRQAVVIKSVGCLCLHRRLWMPARIEVDLAQRRDNSFYDGCRGVPLRRLRAVHYAQGIPALSTSSASLTPQMRTRVRIWQRIGVVGEAHVLLGLSRAEAALASSHGSLRRAAGWPWLRSTTGHLDRCFRNRLPDRRGRPGVLDRLPGPGLPSDCPDLPGCPGMFRACSGSSRQDGCPAEHAESAGNRAFSWWALVGSNHRPLRCQRSALPLS